MILATLKTYSDFDIETLENLEPAKIETFLFDCIQDYYTTTFSPQVETVLFIPLHVFGKTYKERKTYLQGIAKEYQDNFAEYADLSCLEMAKISDFFATYGKRYGLLKEFRENAIC